MIHEQIATAINGQIHIIMNEGNEITRSVKKIEIGEIYLSQTILVPILTIILSTLLLNM